MTAGIFATASVTIGGVSIQVHSGDLEVFPRHVHAFAEPRGAGGYRINNLPEDPTTDWKRVRIGGLQYMLSKEFFGEEQLMTGVDRHGKHKPLMHCVCNVRVERSSDAPVSPKLQLGFVQNFTSQRCARYSDGSVISREHSEDSTDKTAKRPQGPPYVDSVNAAYPFFRTEFRETLLDKPERGAVAIKLSSLKPRFTKGEVFRLETSDAPSYTAPSQIGPEGRLMSLTMRDEFKLFLVVTDGERYYALARGEWKVDLEFQFAGAGAPPMCVPGTETSMRAWVDQELQRKRAEFIAKADMRKPIKQDALPIGAQRAAYRLGNLKYYMASREAVLEGRLDPRFGTFVRAEVSGGGLRWLGDSAGNSGLITNTSSRASLKDQFFPGPNST